jgi:hypothetical protein
MECVMDELTVDTWYVSRCVGLPLDVAARTLDRVFDLPDRRASVGRTPPGLTAATVSVTPLSGSARRLFGALRVDPWPAPIRVELELEPWSSSQSSLGLRPRGRPPRWRAPQYWSSAVSTLERLDAELVAAAPRARWVPRRRVS